MSSLFEVRILCTNIQLVHSTFHSYVNLLNTPVKQVSKNYLYFMDKKKVTERVSDLPEAREGTDVRATLRIQDRL